MGRIVLRAMDLDRCGKKLYLQCSQCYRLHAHIFTEGSSLQRGGIRRYIDLVRVPRDKATGDAIVLERGAAEHALKLHIVNDRHKILSLNKSQEAAVSLLVHINFG